MNKRTEKFTKGVQNQIDKAEEKISRFKTRSFEITHSEEPHEKRMETSEASQTDFGTPSGGPMYTLWESHRRREKGQKTYLKK